MSELIDADNAENLEELRRMASAGLPLINLATLLERVTDKNKHEEIDL